MSPLGSRYSLSLWTWALPTSPHDTPQPPRPLHTGQLGREGGREGRKEGGGRLGTSLSQGWSRGLSKQLSKPLVSTSSGRSAPQVPGPQAGHLGSLISACRCRAQGLGDSTAGRPAPRPACCPGSARPGVASSTADGGWLLRAQPPLPARRNLLQPLPQADAARGQPMPGHRSNVNKTTTSQTGGPAGAG